MSEKYQEWINNYYPTSASSYGNCKEAVVLMIKSFPELIPTNGFVHVYSWNKDRQHWWLKTKEGEIIDPTKNQFPGPIDYSEVDDSHPVRNYESCRCHNCDNRYYLTPGLSNVVCSDACHIEYQRYLTGK
jgi:hypothetical protein